VIRTRSISVAFVALVTVAIAACGSSGGSKGSGGASTSSTTKAAAAPTSGNGTIVLGAEQEMDCADWIANCAGSSWGVWTMEEHTMPRVFDYAQDANGDWVNVPNVMMAEAPTVSTVNGAQTITYKISPKAVWSDGQPIISEDFKYTWEQIAKGKDIYDKSGYDKIASVDTTDPKTAIVTMKQPYGSWRTLFAGGLYGIMPSHILEGKNRAKAMANGYDWSGGPWIAKWHRGTDITLTPNPNWYGEKPKLSKVIFRFIQDTAAEFQAFKSGEVLAIYPQPQLDAVDAIKKGLPGAKTQFTADTGSVESLWINNNKFPFNSVAVRQAFAYAIDREATVTRLFGDLGVKSPTNSLNPPIQKAYSDTSEFAKYTKNPSMVTQLMTSDGWKKNGSGIWAKNGKTATVTINSTTENKRRELTEQIIQQQVRDQGFDLKIKNQTAADLFGKTLPTGNYQLGLYAQQATSLEPGLCSIMCSTNIPSKANGNSGQNWTWTKIPAMDPLLETVDNSSDDNARIAASKEADRIMGQNMVSLPIDPLPDVSIWSTRIDGVKGDNPVFSMFWNLTEWSLNS
jgi:peptide/nickel transport system substrate-binding protein